MKGKYVMPEKKKGLTDDEVQKSREKHGTNKLCEYRKKGFFKSFISNLSDPIIRVLIVALFINIIFMFPNINWFESGGIAIAVFTATFVSTLSEYGSENAFEKLRQENANAKCTVRRNGKSEVIDVSDVVVGDILILEAGVRVQADGNVVWGRASVDESALTGESAEVEKSAESVDKNSKRILRGSLVCSGYAESEVNAVGAQTYYGKVAGELVRDTRPSPLKHRLSHLAKSVSFFGYVASFMIAFAYLFNVFAIDSHMEWSEIIKKLSDLKYVLSECMNALTLAISIIVVAVPEGLPVMITVILSSNMKKMMRDHVLVRKLVGIETSGNIDLLFTDKTGTITEGALKVKEIHTAWGEKYSSLSSLKNNPYMKKYFTLCACYCNGATFNGKTVIGSDATDRAILEYAKDSFPTSYVKDKIPFDSTKKYSAVALKHEGEDYVFFKGAPEKILSASSYFVDCNGAVMPLEKSGLENARLKLKELAKMSYRVVGMGMKIQSTDTSLSKIIYIGLIAIRDKIRKEAPQAIKKVSEAGVGVVMITGDNPDTAEAICTECGIITHHGARQTVLTGTDLEKMTDNEIAKALPTLACIARALPSDKSRLVGIAQSCGYVVGMTGDGINDASSLKLSDVGFAMGSGTDVAKEASDIVISDNNFASIVKAILYGRTIFESIRKFVVFQLTMNLAAVGISLIGPFIGIENPVTVTQMLWVNIIMDTLGALAFATEPADEEYLKRKPKKRDEKIISPEMMNRIISTGIYILALCIWFLKSDTVGMILMRGDEKYLMSAFFAMFIFTGIFVCFTSRTTRVNLMVNLLKNKPFIFIMLLISVMQMTFIYFGGEAFRTVPLTLHDLICVIAISGSVMVFDFVRKLLYKIRNPKRKSVKSHINNFSQL